MSVFGKVSSCISVVRKLVDMVYSFFKWRTSKCRKLKNEISIVEKRLATALSAGRVTAAGKLAEERRKWYEKYRGCDETTETTNEQSGTAG